MLGKLKSIINKLRNEVIQFLPLKGLMIRVEGNGLGNPIIQLEYNVSSVARTGVGVYRLTISQETFYGIPVIPNSVATLTYDIAPNVNTDAYYVALNVISTTVIDVQVFEAAQGAGNKIQYNPYDILAGDTISGSLLFNSGIREQRLPPEL